MTTPDVAVRDVRVDDAAVMTALESVRDVLALSPEERYQKASSKFPDWLLAEPVRFPSDLDCIRWRCAEHDCDNDPVHNSKDSRCAAHSTGQGDDGAGRAGWCRTRLPVCRVCPDREGLDGGLCNTHGSSRRDALAAGVNEAEWYSKQRPLPPYPDCAVPLCVRDAYTIFRMDGIELGRACGNHKTAWEKASKPPLSWKEWVSRSSARMKRSGGDNKGCALDRCGDANTRQAVDQDGAALGDLCLRHFRSWRRESAHRPTFDEWTILEQANRRMIVSSERNELHLGHLPSNAQREIRFAIFRHLTDPRRVPWAVLALRSLVQAIQVSGAQSIQEPALSTTFETLDRSTTTIVRGLLSATRSLTLTPEVSKSEGWFDPVLVGAKPFKANKTGERRSPFILTNVYQTWLRDLLWDYLRSKALLPDPPTFATVHFAINGVVVLSHLLRSVCPDEGVNPALLDGSTALSLEGAWDIALREHQPLPRASGVTAPLSGETMRAQLSQAANNVLAFGANSLPSSAHAFITNLPRYKREHQDPNPRPLSDAVWQALTNEQNLAALDERDSNDVGLVDAWLTHAWHGSRISEIRELPLDCLAVIGGQPFLFRDPTKVGKIGHGIACHPYVYERLRSRQEKTRAKLRKRYATDLEQMTPAQRIRQDQEWGRTMPLMPGAVANRDLIFPVSAAGLEGNVREWLDGLELDEHVTTHQTRHTLCTALLNNGAPPEVLQDIFGWMSHKMIKAYGRYDDATRVEPLRQVWSQGPGMPNPGRPLLTPHDVPEGDQVAFQRQHIDLAVVPVEGGLCQYGPVVGGKDCPWGKNCTTDPTRGPCSHFLLTGADYSYWTRKHEAAITWAEGAPTGEARDYILQAWEGWSDALDGLRSILDDLGLLEAAEQLDLRTPRQDYLGDPLWTHAWPTTELLETEADVAVLDVRDHNEESTVA